MIIHERQGDVFDCSSHTIACPINAAGAMGKGLAKAFKERVPGLYAFYLHHYPKRTPVGLEQRARTLHVFPVPDGRQVLLFPTKVHWTDKSPPALLRANLHHLANLYRTLNIQSLALPALGCGCGELDYDCDVKPMIHEILGPLPLQVEVLFAPDQAVRPLW